MSRLQRRDSIVRYRVRIGLDYRSSDGGFIRREPGDIADDIPAPDIGWLLAQQAIEAIDEEVSQRGD